MKKYDFNYSKKFKCIGSACKHNCCLGWDISLDKKTLSLYNSLSKTDCRFNDNCFKSKSMALTDDFRCPFLDKDNLCHVIKNYGEKALSKTCKTHPRFINYFSSFTETGLGLYCEEACRIILFSKSKMKRVLVYKNKFSKPLSSFEKTVLAFRNNVLKIIQNRELSIVKRLKLLEELSNINLDKKPFSAWAEIFLGLEKLPLELDHFTRLIELKEYSKDYKNEYALSFEQILSYLAFRHLSRAIDEIDLSVRLSFVVLSFKIIYELFSSLGGDSCALIEACRFYTSTVELSDNNLFTLLNEIEKLVVLI